METLTATKEKVYLGDWLYNAGIIGFLRIVGYENNPYLEIGENYIEVDRKILEGFSLKYVDTAFKQYGRFDKNKRVFNELIDKINKKELLLQKQNI